MNLSLALLSLISLITFKEDTILYYVLNSVKFKHLMKALASTTKIGFSLLSSCSPSSPHSELGNSSLSPKGLSQSTYLGIS